MGAVQSSPLPAPSAEARPRRPVVSFGQFAFDPNSRLLSRDGKEVPLPPRVLGVLELLLVRAGEVVNRQELIETIWKDAFVTDTSLAEAVSVLRQTLGDDSQAPTYIQTLHRRGYRFVAPVSPATTAAPAESESLDARVSPSIGKELVPWGLAAVAVCVAAAALWQLTRTSRSEPTITTRFTIAAAPNTTFDTSAPAVAISRDGTRIAWSACDVPSTPGSSAGVCRLYVRSLDRLEPAALAGVEGRAPFFAPDGRWLGYFADGRLMKVALAGGAPTTIADAPTALGGVWIDREIIFAGSRAGGLQRVPADGGEVRTLTRPREHQGEIRHVWPAIVPGTRILIFTIDTTLADAAASAPGSLAVVSLDAIDRNGEASGWRTLLGGASIARAASPDAIVFGRDADLHAVSLDAARLAMSGTPRAIASNLATARGRTQFALSPSGALVYVEAHSADHPLELMPAGDKPSSSWPYRAAALSPDGSRLAGVKIEDTRADIWIAETRRAAATRLTHTGANAAPVWSGDGSTVYFSARSTGPFEIWRRAADGGGAATKVHSSDRHAFPVAVSPDGRSLAFLQSADRTRADLWLLPLTGGSAQPLVQGPLDEGAASFSPDSSLLAYESAETGRWEIYAIRVSDGRRLLVSTNGGRRPIWTPAGLHFQSGSSVMRVAIGAESGDLKVTDSAPVGTIDGDLVGLTADGRFLVQRTSSSREASATVSLNWLRELRTLLGPMISEPLR